MKLKPYPAYQDSGVEWLGQVPDGWEVKPLKHVTSVNDEVLPESTDQDEEIEYVDIGSVTVENGIEKTESMKFSEAPSRARRKVRDGDIIVSTVRTYLKAIAPIESPPENLVCSTGFAVIRPRDRFMPSFAKYSMQSSYFVDEVIARSVGVSYPAINSSEMVCIRIAMPSTFEQSKIASFLDRETDKLDTLIAKQEKLIELLQEKRQAVISHAVTKGLDPDAPMKDSGVEWLGKVPVGWNVKRLKHIKALKPNAFVDGPFGSNLKTEHFILNGDAYVIESNFATQNVLTLSELKTISQEHFETIIRSQTKEGDIIIAKIGAQFGKASILPKVDKPAVVSGNSMKLSVNENLCGNQWAYWQLTNLKAIGEIDLLSNGSAQPALSLGSMNNLPFLLPSISEQVLILEYISKETTKIDILIDKAKRSIELAKEHRTALISAGVTGKIDVREYSC